VHGHIQRFALDVPEREVERAERVRLLAPGRVEPGDVRFLPDRFDPEGILADERAGALLERVLRPALADPGDADIRFDHHHHVALIEERIEVGRPIDPDARDLRLRQVSRRSLRTQQAKSRRRRNRSQETSSIHIDVLAL
jgi:hypothetical protein